MFRHPLNNGLTLEFWDYSRVIGGDRRFVLLEVRIAVPIRPDTLPPELREQVDQVKEALGDEIIFSHKNERNFIAATEAPEIQCCSLHENSRLAAISYYWSIVRLTASYGQAHLDTVLLMVVNQGNSVIGLADAVSGHPRLAILGSGLDRTEGPVRPSSAAGLTIICRRRPAVSVCIFSLRSKILPACSGVRFIIPAPWPMPLPMG
jgi:hypothetical protein